MCQESGLPATAVVAGVASMSGTKSSCPSLEASSTLIRIPDMIRGVSTSRKHSVANDYTPFERLEGQSPRSSREKTSRLGGPLFLPSMNHHSRRFGWWPRSPTYSTRNPLDHPFEEIVLRATMPRGLAIRVPGSSSMYPEPESSSSFLSLMEAESRTNTFFPLTVSLWTGLFSSVQRSSRWIIVHEFTGGWGDSGAKPSEVICACYFAD